MASSEGRDGGPAFPNDGKVVCQHTGLTWRGIPASGMTLRDWFIGQAIIAIYHTDRSRCIYAEDAEDAVKLADAMLAARNAEGGTS